MAFRRILCAVDFSRGSQAAFRRAIQLARQSSADLLLLHALEAQPVISRWLAPDRLGEVTVELGEKAKEAMDSLMESAGSDLDDLSVETEITAGRAATEIVENARRWDADLIVLGARGSASLEEAFMGSTAERVMRYAECSVLIVK